MIGYLDTSALVPLLVREPTSEACRRFRDDADGVVSSRLTYVESAAALARALRMGRLTEAELDARVERLDELWDEFDIADVDEPVVLRAAALSRRFGLRGYGAVHCASAEQLDDADVVAASNDRLLLRSWAELGMATFDAGAAGRR